MLCSDYYPGALIHSLFILHEQYGLDLPLVFRLVSLNPAKAVRIDNQTGSLVPGKRADLLVINRMNQEFPAVTKAFVSGALSFQTSYRGEKE